MKRRVRLALLAMLLAAAAGVLGFFLWVHFQRPGFIPYEAWDVPRHPVFPLWKSDPEGVGQRLGKEDVLGAGDFVFTMGVGGGMSGLDVFRVDADGNARYVFATGDREWWKAEFTMSAPALAKLRQLLVDVDYPALERAYHASVVDGTQWYIRVDAAGTTKKVYCNNYFPEAAERLASAIRREVLPAHEAEIRRARRIWASSAASAAAGLWN